jgi:6-phosphogluconolactonase (cycloisomerase 2 family)
MSPPTIQAGTTPIAITVDPSGQYVYVANFGSLNVSQYIIGAGGALSAMTTPTVTASTTRPSFITVDPSGKYVYVTNRKVPLSSGVTPIDGSVTRLTIGINGSLSPSSPLLTNSDPSSVTVDPSGKYAYLTNFSGGVSQYNISANGVLTLLGGNSIGLNTTSVMTDSSGKYVYVANNGSGLSNNGNISQYTNMLTGGTTIGAWKPYSITVDPSSKYVYAAGATYTTPGNASYSVQPYSIGATGTLTAIGAGIATGASPTCVITTGTWQ